MKIQKSGLIAALTLGTLLACTGVGRAQSTNAPARGARRGSVQQRVDRMNSELNLTADEKSKVTALFEADAKKRQELRADTSLSREEKRAKGQELMAEQDKKLKAILTPDQFEKWQKMRQQFRPRRSGNNPSADKTSE